MNTPSAPPAPVSPNPEQIPVWGYEGWFFNPRIGRLWNTGGGGGIAGGGGASEYDINDPSTPGDMAAAARRAAEYYDSIFNPKAPEMPEFGGFEFPEPPPPPAPPTPPPPPPVEENTGDSEARAKARTAMEQRQRRGRASTILTGPLGVGGPKPTRNAPLQPSRGRPYGKSFLGQGS